MIFNGKISIPPALIASLFASIMAAGILTRTAQAQTLTYDSSTHHDFAAPHTSVAAGHALVGGWVDQRGGVYTVTGSSLKATSVGTTGYLQNLALRPLSETSATPNTEGTIFVPNGVPNPATANGLVLRFQTDGTFYLFQLSPSTLFIYKISKGRTAILLQTIFVHPNPADPYSLTGSAVTTASGVTLSASATDTRTHQPIGSLSTIDNATPILEAGQVGVDSWVGNNAADAMTEVYSRVMFYRLPAASAAASTPLAGPKASLKIGFIGDSITSGYNQVGSTITPGVSDAAALTIKMLVKAKITALADNGIAWNVYDQGISGTSTGDWRPGNPDSPEMRAKAVFTAAFGTPDPKMNPVWILLMLGTNDVRSDNRFTAQQHQNNLQATVEDLVASGFNVIINHAPAFVTSTKFNGVAWDASSLALLQSYLPEEQAVAASFANRAPGRVFMGDTSAFDYFATRPELFQEYGVYGGLHPNGKGGTEALATCWVHAFNQAANIQ